MPKKIKNAEELKTLRDQFKAEMAVRCIPQDTQKTPTLRECRDNATSKSNKSNQS